MKKRYRIGCYRYGTERENEAEIRVGVAHEIPRGVRRADCARLGYFDAWLPLLAPDGDWARRYRRGEVDFKAFARAYLKKMKTKESQQLIAFLGGLCLRVPLSLGCSCKEEALCHRSLLKELIEKAARKQNDYLPSKEEMIGERMRYASPVCYAEEEDGM